MKKRLSLFLAISAIITMLSFDSAQAQDNNTFDIQAMTMLKDFYTRYMTEFSDTGSLKIVEAKLNAIKKKYCTTKLLEKIPKMAEEADNDPLLKAQDSDAAWAKTLSINKDMKKPNDYVVSYMDGNKTKYIIHLHVAKEQDSFKIADVW